MLCYIFVGVFLCVFFFVLFLEYENCFWKMLLLLFGDFMLYVFLFGFIVGLWYEEVVDVVDVYMFYVCKVFFLLGSLVDINKCDFEGCYWIWVYMYFIYLVLYYFVFCVVILYYIIGMGLSV